MDSAAAGPAGPDPGGFAAGSQQVRLPRWEGNRREDLVLEDKPLDAFKHPDEDQEDADVLNPGELDGFPESWPVSGGEG